MGAKIEDDTQAKKEEIEAEPPEKKVKVSNSQVMILLIFLLSSYFSLCNDFIN